MKKTISLLALTAVITLAGCSSIEQPDTIEEGADNTLAIYEIANTSKCTEEGELTGDFFYNETTKTWWFDLDIDKPGCSPACVVSEENWVPEINWRCTGLVE